MEDKMVVITSDDQVWGITADIIDCLSYSIDIHILKTSHMMCESDKVLFQKYANNNEKSIRVIFINSNLENEFREMEKYYYKESRRSLYPHPSDPFDKFKWHCPICLKKFHKM